MKLIVVRLVSDEMRQVFTDPLVVLEQIRYKDRFRLVAQDLLDIASAAPPLLQACCTETKFRLHCRSYCQREVQMMAKGGDNLRKARTPRAAMVTVIHRTEDALRV